MRNKAFINFPSHKAFLYIVWAFQVHEVILDNTDFFIRNILVKGKGVTQLEKGKIAIGNFENVKENLVDQFY
jgi:hypothetical protein